MTIPGPVREEAPAVDFIRAIVADDLQAGKNEGRVATRFPPEPNGYLHIGHAKSICLNFGVAGEFGGTCNLRFDDTNPTKEDVELRRVHRRGCQVAGFHLERRTTLCVRLFFNALRVCRPPDPPRQGLRRQSFGRRDARVPWNADRARSREPLSQSQRRGKPRFVTPHEGRGVRRRRARRCVPGSTWPLPTSTCATPCCTGYGVRTITAPATPGASTRCTTSRILHPTRAGVHHALAVHARIRGPSTAVRLAHREPAGTAQPRRIEFARLNLTYTVLSKRRLLELVEEGHVSGWDDPRMPTLVAMRRRGYTPEAIRSFCERIGVAKRENVVDVALLEHAVREDLKKRAPRLMGVLNPLRVVVENYPEGQSDEFDIIVNPEDAQPVLAGCRSLASSSSSAKTSKRIRRRSFSDWRQGGKYGCAAPISSPAQDSRRMTRARSSSSSALTITLTRGGDAPDGRKVKSTLHWVSAAHAVHAQIRLDHRLFTSETPGADRDYRQDVNPASLQILDGCKLEPAARLARPGDRFQFERMGYFCVDSDSTDGRLVFNRTVTLKDTWARIRDKT